MTMIRHLALVVALASGTGAARAEDADLAQDRAVLASCIRTADGAKRPRDTCLGVVSKPCMERSGGDTTAGMNECTGRETAVWDERLNRTYRAAIDGDFGREQVRRDGSRRVTGGDLLRDAQRAWIAFRDRKCEAATLPMNGGSGASLLAGDCILTETARQSLWLEGLVER